MKTYLPILKYICEDSEIQINNIFEYGNSIYKTKLFSDKLNVSTIEIDKETIFEEEFSTIVFIDGNPETRWKLINESFNKTDIIIVPDTEMSCYNWDLVKKPENNEYYWLDIKIYNPWTSVITRNRELIHKLSKHIDAKIRDF
jgi:hypothetical protein